MVRQTDGHTRALCGHHQRTTRQCGACIAQGFSVGRLALGAASRLTGFLGVVVGVFYAAILQAQPVADIVVADDVGAQVRLASTATRIVSLAPHITEMLYAAGAGAYVVGVVEYSDYPPQAKQLPSVGNYDRVDIEGILKLQPDLVVAWASGNDAQQIKRLQSFGLTVFLSEPGKLSGIASNLRALGKLAGTSNVAAAAADQFDVRLAKLQSAYADRAPVRVFYQVWNEPLMSIGGEHLISHVMRLCGGSNVFATLDGLAPVVSVEAVLAANPEVIIASGAGTDTDADTVAQRPTWLDDWRNWPTLAAVKNDALGFVAAQHIQRHTPRLLMGAEQMCALLNTVRNARH